MYFRGLNWSKITILKNSKYLDTKIFLKTLIVGYRYSYISFENVVSAKLEYCRKYECCTLFYILVCEVT